MRFKAYALFPHNARSPETLLGKVSGLPVFCCVVPSFALCGPVTESPRSPR